MIRARPVVRWVTTCKALALNVFSYFHAIPDSDYRNPHPPTSPSRPLLFFLCFLSDNWGTCLCALFNHYPLTCVFFPDSDFVFLLYFSSRYFILFSYFCAHLCFNLRSYICFHICFHFRFSFGQILFCVVVSWPLPATKYGSPSTRPFVSSNNLVRRLCMHLQEPIRHVRSYQS